MEDLAKISITYSATSALLNRNVCSLRLNKIAYYAFLEFNLVTRIKLRRHK